MRIMKTITYTREQMKTFLLWFQDFMLSMGFTGAYDAGYYFCFNFEAPAARTSQSTKRGNYAKDTLYPMK